MTKFKTIPLLLISIPFLSCKNNKTSKNNNTIDSIKIETNSNVQDSAKTEIITSKLDSTSIKNTTDSILTGNNLKTDDYIKQYPTNQKAELRRQIEWYIEEWKNVPNPLIATYAGNEFGDYHHVIFKDASGKEYDFGQSKNNYGKYKLHELDGQYDDNLTYLGKQFKIYWDWKLTAFLCCDGEYGKAVAYLPTITKLELVKK